MQRTPPPPAPRKSARTKAALRLELESRRKRYICFWASDGSRVLVKRSKKWYPEIFDIFAARSTPCRDPECATRAMMVALLLWGTTRKAVPVEERKASFFEELYDPQAQEFVFEFTSEKETVDGEVTWIKF